MFSIVSHHDNEREIIEYSVIPKDWIFSRNNSTYVFLLSTWKYWRENYEENGQDIGKASI